VLCVSPQFLRQLALAGANEAIAQAEKQITIFYDAFGGVQGLKRDWGFAAFIEYNGHRILFDTGNNAKHSVGRGRSVSGTCSVLRND
jgi:7,8-dihydropterin-6-yl-methyl-4-(beta-D-ribofuranosyl)aminobenzene 5'-phosphate synthase